MCLPACADAFPSCLPTKAGSAWRQQPSAQNHFNLVCLVTVARSMCNVIGPHEGSEGPHEGSKGPQRGWDEVMGEDTVSP